MNKLACVIGCCGWMVLAGWNLAHAEQPALPKRQPGELGRHVDAWIGTGGVSYLSGYNFPGATSPFGMMRLSPDTISRAGKRALNTSGYYYRDDRIIGFSHTRLVGTGAAEGGNFLVVPSNAPWSADAALGTPYKHDKEAAFPGYYGVELPELGVTAELTATQRVGVHRYTFAADRTPRLQMHVTSAMGKGHCTEGEVRVLPEARELEGAARTFATFSSRHNGDKVYFVARFNRPFKSFGTWQGKTLEASRASVTGDDIGVDLAWEQDAAAAPLELTVGISYVSIKNARENLAAEVGNADFAQVLEKAKQAWEEKLSRARVTGGTPKQRKIYYTALYRVFNMPTAFNDVNGEYTGFDKQVHKAEGFTYYTDFSLWDTFRTVHPLYCLIAPREQRDMAVSFVEMSKQGGYLPRWPSGTRYTRSMFGTPADIMLTETYLKGIRDFDVETAYQAMLKTALKATPPGGQFNGREGIEGYLKYHYCPSDTMQEAVSQTLEYCHSDHAIARLAEALGHREDAALFDEHAQYYRNLWNPETQYFQPRDTSGKFFADFRPLMLTYADFARKHTDDYVEGSALQWRWAVAFDPQGLISLFKSREYFIDELNTFFAKATPKVGLSPNPYYWQGNQPDIYAAMLFNAAGRPDLTQKWVRWILENKYGDQENGLDGNDDGGTLSAWYVLASLGFYPTAGSDRYEITSPLWQKAELNVGQSKPLVIEAPATSAENQYVGKVSLQGKPIEGTSLRHAPLAEGGLLTFEMQAQPATR